MKRINSKAALLKHRVRVIHGRAKFVGVLYLIGTIAFLAAAALSTMIDGTVLAINKVFPMVNLPVLTFYRPIVTLVQNVTALTTDMIWNCVVAVLYAILLLVLLINALKAISKLGWLFKRRASYTNGFNRNMYAMDDLADCFSSSLGAIVIINVLTYLFTATPETTVSINMVGFITLGAGLALHFICGIIGGTVTLFTTADNMEEEPREFGVFTFFVRNLVQIAAVAALLYFFVPHSGLSAALKDVIYNVVEKANSAWLTANIMSLLPAAAELVAWVCMFVLIKHALSETEYNRDCLDGSGMKNFTVFSLLTTVCLAAMIVLPMLGMGAALAQEKMMGIIIAAAIAFVAFLLDCIIKPRHRGDYDDVDMEAYFRGGNIII